MDLKLSDDGDLLLSKNDFVLTNSVAQQCEIALKWFLGEWKFNQLLGVDYIGEAFTKSATEESIRNMITEELEEIEDVMMVETLSTRFNEYTRELSIVFSVLTVNGIEEGEAKIDG